MSYQFLLQVKNRKNQKSRKLFGRKRERKKNPVFFRRRRSFSVLHHDLFHPIQFRNQGESLIRSHSAATMYLAYHAKP